MLLTGTTHSCRNTVYNSKTWSNPPRFKRNHNCKLKISTPTKAKSWELAYSQALIQNKIDRQWVRSRESGRQVIRRLWWKMFGVETGEGGREKRMNQIRFVEEQSNQFGVKEI